MSFAAVRHPDIEVIGICPKGAYEMQRAHGWIRLSPWVAEPADLHLPDYEDSFEDLDAEPPAKKTKSPAKPEKDEEQAS